MGITKVFTHSDLDGIGCALLLRRWKGDANVEVEHCSTNEVDEKISDWFKTAKLSEYSTVYITDISIKSPELITLITSYCNRTPRFVRLIDHHKTALHLTEYPWATVEVIHANGKSACGTTLVYQHIVSQSPGFNQLGLGELVETIRKYDTWDWKKENYLPSYHLNMLIRLRGFDYIYSTYANYAGGELFSPDDWQAIEAEKTQIEKYIDKAMKRVRYETFMGHKLAICFGGDYINDLAERMYATLPVDVAVVMDLNKERMSFRTAKDIDLTPLALFFKGGGHPKSCGASIPKTLMDSLVYSIFQENSTTFIDARSYLPNVRHVSTIKCKGTTMGYVFEKVDTVPYEVRFSGTSVSWQKGQQLYFTRTDLPAIKNTCNVINAIIVHPHQPSFVKSIPKCAIAKGTDVNLTKEQYDTFIGKHA